MAETSPTSSTACLIYGAYGYTGALIAREAAGRGLTPILAGRDRERTEALATDLGLEARVFELDSPARVAAALDGVAAVVHAAGPFVDTWRPMAHGCLRAGCHYLDVTGEIEVLESLHALDQEAREAGVALLPAVGFDVVPTDCAAALVAATVADPDSLELAFHARGKISRGTLRTAIGRLGGPSRVRRDGRIVPVELGSIRREIPFSHRPRDGVAIPWGDVSTAFHSTGVPNVTVYQSGLADRLDTVRRFGFLLRRPLVRRLLQWWVGRTVVGPDEQERATARMRVWAEARGADDAVATAELTCPDGYSFTADSATTAVRTLLDPDADGPRRGFLTPSLAFGAGFVDRMAGVEWHRRP